MERQPSRTASSRLLAQESGVVLPGVTVRADGVDDPPGGQVEAWSLDGVPDVQAAGQLGAAQRLAGGEQLRAGGTVDGAIDSSSAQKRAVGGVDDGVDLLRGDVTGDGFDSHPDLPPGLPGPARTVGPESAGDDSGPGSIAAGREHVRRQ